jgi:hypothetical protein
MQIVAIVESDDCGPAVVLDSDLVKITKMGDFYLGASRCVYSNMPVVCEISEEIANQLILNGVECLNVSTSTNDTNNAKD